MQRKSKNGVEWLEFDLLSDIPGLFHGVFLRKGGVSKGAYDSLNTGLSVGDDPADVAANLRKVQEIAGVNRLIGGRQNHGSDIAFVTKESWDENEICDGLLTPQAGIGLMVKHADCQAAIFYDPILRLLGNVHAGWRGNVLNIYAAMIEKMKKCGSKPENLLVCISPSLGPEASEFKNYQTEFPETFVEFQWKPLHFNLWEVSRSQLERCGVLPHHIEIASLCTYGNQEDYFSYRRAKVSGRNATVAALLNHS